MLTKDGNSGVYICTYALSLKKYFGRTHKVNRIVVNIHGNCQSEYKRF